MEQHVSLRVDRVGPVAQVTLVGHGKENAMGPDFWRELPGRSGRPLVAFQLVQDKLVRMLPGCSRRSSPTHSCTSYVGRAPVPARAGRRGGVRGRRLPVQVDVSPCPAFIVLDFKVS